MLIGLPTFSGEAIDAEIASNRLVVLLCSHPSQAVGHLMAAMLERVARGLSGQVSAGLVDSARDSGRAAAWDALRMPTILVFVDGELVDRMPGGVTSDELADRIGLAVRIVVGHERFR